MEKNAHQNNFSVVKNLPKTPMVESVFQNDGSVIIIGIVKMGRTKSIVVSTFYIFLVKIHLRPTNDQFYFVTAAFNFDMNIQNMVARRKMNEMRLEFMYAILRLSYEIELIIA